MSIDEKTEALIDKAVLSALDIDAYKKMNASLLLVMHRQLLTLSKHTGVAIEDMDREFILQNVAKIEVTDETRLKAKVALEKLSKS